MALKQPVVWITGASSGLGLYTAQALRDAGFLVIAGARSFKDSAQTEDGIHRLSLDVTSDESAVAFCEAALRISPRVDALVNCAGVLVLGSCEETPLTEYRRVMETNFLGMVRMNQAVLPYMRAQGGGKIVMYSSINGLLGIPYQSAYTASKHAVEGYAECLAMETKRFGVQVCLVEPGDHRGGSQAYRGRAAEAVASPYHADCARAAATIHRDESGGSDPAVLGRKVARMLLKKHIPFRKCIAKPDQHLAVALHKLLPPKLNAAILRQYYLGDNQRK